MLKMEEVLEKLDRGEKVTLAQIKEVADKVKPISGVTGRYISFNTYLSYEHGTWKVPKHIFINEFRYLLHTQRFKYAEPRLGKFWD